MKLPVNMFSGRFLPLRAASSSPSDGKAQQGLIPGLKSNRSKLVVGKSWEIHPAAPAYRQPRINDNYMLNHPERF